MSKELINYERACGFDTLDVKIYAQAINYRKDDRTNKYLEGSKDMEAFSEIWTFVRKQGSKTTGKLGLMEGTCPNCGNPIKIGRLTKCDVCGSMLRSGDTTGF